MKNIMDKVGLRSVTIQANAANAAFGTSWLGIKCGFWHFLAWDPFACLVLACRVASCLKGELSSPGCGGSSLCWPDPV
jgi:hypothetical protein